MSMYFAVCLRSFLFGLAAAIINLYHGPMAAIGYLQIVGAF